MDNRILIVEANDGVRTRLHSLLTEEPMVMIIQEAKDEASFIRQLYRFHPDLMVMNQGMIGDITSLPRGRFIVLADRPDIAILKKSFLHGARGYLSTQSSSVTFQSILQPASNNFVLDPLFIPWILEQIFHGPLASIQDRLLTSREKEIVTLLRAGNDRESIANKLSISESTLKTHLRNIARKREFNPRLYFASQVLGGKQYESHLDVSNII